MMVMSHLCRPPSVHLNTCGVHSVQSLGRDSLVRRLQLCETFHNQEAVISQNKEALVEPE